MQFSRLVVCAALTAAILPAQSSVIGAGYSAPFPIKVAPGQLITFFVNGIGAGLTTRAAANSLPLPYSLAGISVTIDELSNPPLRREKVPILAVGPMGGAIAVTVQIPFGMRTSSFLAPDIPPPATLTIYENDIAAVTIAIAPVPDRVHIATTCDANLTTPVAGALCRPVFARADGSLVTPENPAHTGELLVMYAYGLGATNPGMAAGDAAISPQPAATTPTLSSQAAITAIPSQRLTFSPIFAGLAVGFSGLYQINFLAPAPPLPFAPPDCNTFDSPNGNVAITIRGIRGASSDSASVCIVP